MKDKDYKNRRVRRFIRIAENFRLKRIQLHNLSNLANVISRGDDMKEFDD